MVEYQGYSVLAQLDVSDMCIPIQYTFTWPEHLSSSVNRLSSTEFSALSSYLLDEQAFPCPGLAKQVAQQGGLTPAVMDGTNEEVIKLLLPGRTPFLQILRLVETAMKRQAAG